MKDRSVEKRTRRLSDLARQRSRDLRRSMTRSESLLWDFLRNRTFQSHKFVRQHPIGPYFADFVCRRAKLIVELDGQGHDQNLAHDARRDAYLQRKGYRILRVSSAEMIRNPDGILSLIAAALAEK